MIGNVITAPLFGLAPNYTWAIIFRSISGLVNGNTGVAKAYATEITDDTNSAKLFSYLGFSWGIGVMLGPILGGGLSRISDKIPSIFSPDGFWGDYPYFLPMLTSSFISLIGLVIGYFVLNETNRKVKVLKSPWLLTKKFKFFNMHHNLCCFWAIIFKFSRGLSILMQSIKSKWGSWLG
mmetsp:Transcript_28942/g.28633  ORF Transcript_28942/g.28633 Transcript_28942/m.28633 type:complete len:179 (-) Transcript_28942:566-1102(-)